MLQTRIALLMLFCSLSAFAGEMGRDLYLPVVGRAAGSGGREYRTQLWLMNPTDHRVDVAITFLRHASKDQPQSISIRLPPASSVTQDLDERLLGAGNAVGALRVRAKHEIAASARIYSVVAGEPVSRSVGASMDAVAPNHAIAVGQKTLLAADPGARYKLYGVETSGSPIQISVRLLDEHAQQLASRRLYLEPRASHVWDLSAMMPQGKDATWVEVSGVNGSGRCLVAGESIYDGSRDKVFFTMSTVTTPRFRLSAGEIAVILAASLALIVAALVRRR